MEKQDHKAALVVMGYSSIVEEYLDGIPDQAGKDELRRSLPLQV